MLARQLEQEIQDQRTLLLAERGELVPRPAHLLPAEALRQLQAVTSSQPAAHDRRLELDPGPPGLAVYTDGALLSRVLVNMARNALEATLPGGAIRAWVAAGEAEGRPGVRFSVWNPGAIPPEHRPRLFQRSFTTKAARGHGFGTYSMKLLGERYLGGRVSFRSSPEDGTTFSLWLPLEFPGATREAG